METQLKMVEEFHKAFGQKLNEKPQLLDEQEFILRHKLMNEECHEYLDACWANDMVAVADALGDQLYILLGTILKHGLQDKIAEVFAEIQRSNMSKLGEDGKPVLREDGKIMKGPGYTKPDILSILTK